MWSEILNKLLEKRGYVRVDPAAFQAAIKESRAVRSPDLPDTFQGAAKKLKDKAFLTHRRYAQQQVRADREGCDPEILKFERAFIRLCESYDIPMFCHCAFRSADEQDAVYKAGQSRAKPGQSPHNFGMAVDLVHSTRGWQLGGRGWDLIGHIGKEAARRSAVKVVWGGDWKFYDPAHWELEDWRQRAAPLR